ncbi:nuclease [Halobacteriales archaeon SW_5_70_135]|nr:MAG: nuclease [Halobacteriales archaeon SW_5_70_135]
MTLDPVHFEGITRLFRRVERGLDRREHREFAETVWGEFLDPLVEGDVCVLEPISEQRRRTVNVEDVALIDPPFPTRHGLDSGTINPTTYRNGLVVDVAQAAMSAVPSDLDLHRARTVVQAVHSNDATVVFEDEPSMFDDGYVEGRVLHAPRVNRYEGTVVHELALYTAESEHALRQAGVVEDLLVLDGPVYPKGMLNWADRSPELAQLLDEDRPRDVVENYLRLVERFVERDVPLVGFVKTPVSRAITRTVRGQRGAAPWVNDAAFLSDVLERRKRTDDGYERRTDALSYTNWFVSRGGADRRVSAASGQFEVDRALPPASYEVTFFAVYDPRDDALYRVEAPRAFTDDADLRERIERQVLSEVAARRGPPQAVAKADELARVSREETRALREAIGQAFDVDRDAGYNERRWDEE